MVVFGQNGCIRTKVVAFGQTWLCSGKSGLMFEQKWLYSGKSGCNTGNILPEYNQWLNSGEKLLYSGTSGRIGLQKWLYSCKSRLYSGLKWLYFGKLVVFGQSGCIRAILAVFGQKKFVFGKNWFVRAKVVVFGKSGCIWTKWLYSEVSS